MPLIYRKARNKFQITFPGIWKHIDKYKLYIKYFVSGSTAAFVHLSLLFIFTHFFHIWYILSTSMAFIAAFFVSFNLQKFWTFRDDEKKGQIKQMSIFFSVNAVNLFINAGGMYVLVDALDIWYMLAQIIMSLLIALESFVVYRIIFKKGKQISYGE